MALTGRGAPAILLGMVLLLAVSGGAAQEPPGFVRHQQPRAVPEIVFEDGAGMPLRLADFRGKVVLLNLWATWCAPCRREMPTLDRLQTMLGGPDFEVVALSVDREGSPAVEAFYEELGLEALAIYVDDTARASRTLRALGLPTTLLVNREGEEVGRQLGPAEWDSPAMVAFLRRQLGASGSPSPTVSARKAD